MRKSWSVSWSLTKAHYAGFGGIRVRGKFEPWISRSRSQLSALRAILVPHRKLIKLSASPLPRQVPSPFPPWSIRDGPTRFSNGPERDFPGQIWSIRITSPLVSSSFDSLTNRRCDGLTRLDALRILAIFLFEDEALRTKLDYAISFWSLSRKISSDCILSPC